MDYVSPFTSPCVDHDGGPDALCMSRVNVPDIVETLAEFRYAAEAAIGVSASLPAFFLSRQLAELSLKALCGGNLSKALRKSHSLKALLRVLEENNDDLFGDDPERMGIVAFIRDLDGHDPVGDQGRYAATSGGTPSLSTVCCADPDLLLMEVDRLYLYVGQRLRYVGQRRSRDRLEDEVEMRYASLDRAIVVRPETQLGERAQQAVAAVGSNLNAHVEQFFRWLVGDTDELPPRPNPEQ